MIRTRFFRTAGPAAETAAPVAFRLGYRPALDGLRGLSILAVVLLHTSVPWALGGWVGVDVFFVLSGFLITSLLLQEWDRTGTIHFRNFYLRRALRLLPALVVMLGACWLYARFCLPPAEQALTRKGVLSALGYYANWRIILHLDGHDLFMHTWSLSVEEQFYLLWPLALGVMLWLRLRRRWVAALVVGGIAASAGLRAALWQGFVRSFPELYMRLATRADTLLIGCLTALLLSWGLAPRSRLGRGLTHAAAVAAFAYLVWVCAAGRHGSAGWYYGGFTLVAAAVAILVVSLLSTPPRAFTWLFEFPPLVWLGRLSYGLYLWHYPLCVHGYAYTYWILLALRRTTGLTLPVALHRLCVYAVSLGVAVLSFYLVEQPFLRLKGRLGKSVAEAPTPRRQAA